MPRAPLLPAPRAQVPARYENGVDLPRRGVGVREALQHPGLVHHQPVAAEHDGRHRAIDVGVEGTARRVREDADALVDQLRGSRIAADPLAADEQPVLLRREGMPLVEPQLAGDPIRRLRAKGPVDLARAAWPPGRVLLVLRRSGIRLYETGVGRGCVRDPLRCRERGTDSAARTIAVANVTRRTTGVRSAAVPAVLRGAHGRDHSRRGLRRTIATIGAGPRPRAGRRGGEGPWPILDVAASAAQAPRHPAEVGTCVRVVRGDDPPRRPRRVLSSRGNGRDRRFGFNFSRAWSVEHLPRLAKFAQPRTGRQGTFVTTDSPWRGPGMDHVAADGDETPANDWVAPALSRR